MGDLIHTLAGVPQVKVGQVHVEVEGSLQERYVELFAVERHKEVGGLKLLADLRGGEVLIIGAVVEGVDQRLDLVANGMERRNLLMLVNIVFYAPCWLRERS